MTDKPPDPKELERQKLLEEIRKRAEEAELRRIESQEDQSAFEIQTPEEEQAEAAPARPQQTPPPVLQSNRLTPADEHRLIELRGRFAVAIDRKDVEAASDIILDLAAIIPDTTELASYEKMLRSLRMEMKEARAKPARMPAEDDDAREQKERKKQSRVKKIAGLMEESVSFYEQEKYDKAAASVKELLEFDPENEEAAALRVNIEKAQDLAAEVRAEEARRKAEDAAVRPPGPEPVPEPPPAKGDFWGSSEVSVSEPDFGLNIEKDSPPPKPKVPLGRKLAERASEIKVPVKPIIFSAVMILAIIGGYYIAGEIQSAAAELSSSVVVLPGWHTPSDSLATFLAYSLTEQITAELSRSPDLRTIAPYSASNVRYVRGGPAAAARNLGVMHYLHWNIQTTPAAVTFDITLRDTESVDPVWTVRKQSSIRELPAAVREIAAGVLNAMELGGPENEIPSSSEVMTANPDAFLRYLEGRFMLANPRRYPLAETAVMFDRALQNDGGFVEARVSKAWCYLLQAESSAHLSGAPVADAAVMLRDGSGLAGSSAAILAAHGLLHQLQGGYDKALEFLNTGIRQFPGDAELRRRLALVAMIRGDSKTAIENAQRAVAFDPLNPQSHFVLGTVYRSEGNDRAALASYERGAALSPVRQEALVAFLPELLVAVQHHDSAEVILSNEIGRSREDYLLYYRLGRVYQAAGKQIERWEEVLNRSRDLILRRLSSAPNDGVARSYLALVLTRLGRQKEAESEINRALRDHREHPVVLYNAARAYSMRKEYDASLEYLDKAIGLRYDPSFVFDMDFYNLRNEADFSSVATR
jgi:tetratricopeptide (TPR) repeat protein